METDGWFMDRVMDGPELDLEFLTDGQTDGQIDGQTDTGQTGQRDTPRMDGQTRCLTNQATLTSSALEAVCHIPQFYVV